MCNVEVVIDSIIINVKEQLRKKSENYTQRKHTTYIKGTKTQIKTEGGSNCKEKQWKENEGEGRNKKTTWSIKRTTLKNKQKGQQK